MAAAQAGAAPGRAAPARADAAAWLAVAAGTLGAFMAALDVSIVNSALPTIQGEIGASGTEGTWIATAYLVSEIVIIPMAAWLVRMLGLRTFLLIAAVLFTIFSVICGVSTSLGMMVFGRVGQGFTGGALIPTAQVIIAQRLPPRQQPIGIAAFGATATLGPLAGPLIGGWLTENISWHYAFFLNVPICAILVTLLLVGLPHERSRLHLIREADWKGIAGLTLGLGGLTVFLEEGQREQWFDSELIRIVFGTMLIGIALLMWGQVTAKRPIIKLRLLLDRQFGSVALMGVALGVVLYGTSYAIPQFLNMIAGYNALQSGKVVLLSGVPTLALMVIVPLIMRRVDIRIAVTAGFAIMGASALLDTTLTVASTGSTFVDGQLLRGAGQILVMLFLSQAVVRAVPTEDAGDASGLFNAFRNLGGSLALAAISVLQEQRLWLHSRRLEETLNANNAMVQERVAGLGAQVGDPAAGIGLLGRQLQEQALVMTYSDIFWVIGIMALAVMPLVLFLRPLPGDAEPTMVH